MMVLGTTSYLTINGASGNLANTALGTITNNGTITLQGNWINNGAFTDNNIYTSLGVVNFLGTSAQDITGPTTFSNVTINNASGVTLNSTATINGILTLTAGTLATGGNLNQNLYNGAIAGTGSGATTGNIRFFKTIWGDRYHYLSSPIAAKTAADWNDNVTIKFGANANLYSYNEALPDSNQKIGWSAIGTTATALANVAGYALFFPRYVYNTMLDVSGAYTHTVTFTSAGLTNTPSTTPVSKPSSDGWNLVGNPYPTTLDWTIGAGWTKPALLGNAIYMWDGRKNRYTSYVAGIGTNGGSQYIGSMQGFFVKMAAGGSGTLSINNNARVTSILHDVWRTEQLSNVLRIVASIDTITDETVVRFTDDATELFDDQLDAYKLYNSDNTPSLSSVSSNENYSVNSLPFTSDQKTIPLELITALNGTYTLTSDISTFSDNTSLILEDRLLGISQRLNENNSYTVSLNKGSYQGRFFINYTKQNTVTDNHSISNANAGIEIGAYNQNIFINFLNQYSGSAQVKVFDAVGRVVYDMENTNVKSSRVDFSLPHPDGIYLVKVVTASRQKIQQVYIHK